jgi:hypothetical protein
MLSQTQITEMVFMLAVFMAISYFSTGAIYNIIKIKKLIKDS